MVNPSVRARSSSGQSIGLRSRSSSSASAQDTKNAKTAEFTANWRWLERSEGPNRAARREIAALRAGRTRGLNEGQVEMRIAALLGAHVGASR